MAETVTQALEKFFTTATYPIVFTGAGVSAKAGLPAWQGLIEQLAEGLRRFDPLTTQQMLECLRTGALTLAADYFKLSSKMVDGDKQRLLVDILSAYDASAITSVAELPARAYLTTNFDRSIFDAIAASKHVSARDFKYGDLSFRQAHWEEGLFVARIHGAVEMPQHVVLSESQFKTLLTDDTYADLLRACFVHRNVLFLGFSFYDPAIRHVFEDLDRRFGSASSGRHMALLPSDTRSEFSQKAHRLNIEIVEYDAADRHAALWNGLAAFNAKRRSTAAASVNPKVSPFDFTKRYLAACYARARSQTSAAPLREAVVEGIISAIAQEAAPQAISRPDLLDKVRQALGVKGNDVEAIVDAAIRALVDAGLCRKLKGSGGRGIKVAWVGTVQQADSLDAAISVLANSVKTRAYLQEGWKTGKEVQDTMFGFFSQLIRRRGWDLGAAFAAGRAPESMGIELLLNECAIGLTPFDRERLLRVCVNLFQHPSQEETVVLGELGRVSFAVELAFQSPRSSLLHKAILPRRIYFDASVLLPALVEGHPFSQIYRSTIKRLKEAASSAAIQLQLRVCTVYLNEIVSHRRNAIEYSEEAGDDFPAVARSDAVFHGVPNVNVYVGAYANWAENHGPLTFKEFLSRVAPYTSEPQLRRWLVAQGFDIVDAVKGASFPALYSCLETANADQLAFGKGPILIEHDAIQLSMLDAEISKGNRALFVTADRQLRQAISDSKYQTISETMVSHVGLIQFVELLLGGIADGAGLAELLWSARISDRSQAVRSYFTTRGLEQYDEGLAMAMPKVIEKYTETASAELERLGANLETQDPKKRAEAFRTLGSLERNYLSGMQEAVERLQASSVNGLAKKGSQASG